MRWDLLAVLAIVGLSALFVGQAFLPGKVLLPLDLVVQQWPPWQQPGTVADVHNPLISDVVDYIYPVKAFMGAQVRAGTLPLWNPHVLGGYPLTYNTQAGLWYPLSVLYYLLPSPTAVDLTIFLQLALGGVFKFAYLRLIRLRVVAALLGAVIFLFNGMMVVWLEWQVVHAAVIWLPLCLYFLERMVQGWETGRPKQAIVRDAVLAGGAFALPWLGGHWNWALYGSLTAVAYGIWRIGGWLWRRWAGARPPLRTAMGAGLLTLFVGTGLSLIQVLPAFVYLRQGHRQPFAFGEALALGLKDRAVVAVLPDFFGSPLRGDWWGPTNYNETAFYLGILPLFLVVLALALRRDRVTWFYGAWGALGLLWALGTPVYGMLWALPVFNGLWPSRAVTVAVFCGAVLAASGLDALLAKPVRARRLLGVALGVLLVGVVVLGGYGLFYRPEWVALRDDLLWLGLMTLAALALLWGFGRGWSDVRRVALLALLLVTVDLFWAGYRYNTVGDVADLYPPTETGAFLQADREPFRIATLPEGVAYPPNTNLVDGLSALGGYEPAILQTWVDYLSAAEGGEAIYFERELMPLRGLESPLLDAVNVKYVVTIGERYASEPVSGPSRLAVSGWAPLANEPLAQPFQMPDAGLHRIDLPLQIGAGAAGQVVVRVFSADGVQEFANAAWDVGQSRAEGWASFYFEAFPSEWGRAFLFQVTYAGEGTVEVGASGDGLAYRTFYLPRPQLAHEAGKTRVYLNEGYFPRAYVVSQATTARNASEALAGVVANQDRLDEVVVLETSGLPQEFVPGAAGSARVTTYTPNRVVVEAEMQAPGYLVLADTYYPGWEARVGGEPLEVLRANSVVRAVWLPAGQQEVVFQFRPLDFYVGAAISLATLVLACGLLVSIWLGDRRHP